MVAAPNAFVIVGDTLTVTLAEAVPPVPPSVELIVPVVLFLIPAVVLVTFTAKVHAALAARVAPAKPTLPEPATAVIVPPPHVPLRPFGVLTTSPAGSVSVNATPVTEDPLLGLVMVKLKLVVPFTAMVAAPNAFVMVGEASTVTLAEAVPPVPPSVELIVPVVLFLTPAVVLVTFTAKVHAALAASVAPAKPTLPEPATAVIVPPPHVPLRPFGVLTTSPAGSVSVTATLVTEDALGLVTVKLKLVVPFTAMVAAPNAFVMVGEASTVTLAEAVPPVPPSVELIVPVVLFLIPPVVPVTFTAKVHAALAASVAPAKPTLPEPATAVIRSEEN